MFYVISVVIVVLVIAGFFGFALISRARKRARRRVGKDNLSVLAAGVAYQAEIDRAEPTIADLLLLVD